MYYALVYYPHIKHKGFQSFRHKYEPYSELLPEHVPFIYPVPDIIGREKLEKHIKKVLSSWKPFDVHFCTLEKTWDHWLYLGVKEGYHSVVKLHDKLYEGILSPYLRKDLPFNPHIGLGLFSKEAYDFNNPTAQLSLDEKKYNRARKEFEEMNFDLWCTVNKLSLVKINSDFTECVDLTYYKMVGGRLYGRKQPH